MNKFNVLNTETNRNAYPDENNVAVTIELDNENTWYVQTDKNGNFNHQSNCEIYLNDSNDDDFSELPEFDFIIQTAQKIAKETLYKLS